MAIRIPTSDQSKIFLGSQEIGAVYVGANKVWPDAPVIDPNALVIRVLIPTNNFTITIPFRSATGYNGVINWKDGKPNSIITAYNDTDRIHTYSIAGIYDIELTGFFPRLGWTNQVASEIIQWGTCLSDLTRAFNNCSLLSGVVPNFPNHITAIGDYAFQYSAISSINLSGITTIGRSALAITPNLHTVTFMPENILSGTGSFGGGGLTSFVIDANRLNIGPGGGLFQQNSQLTGPIYIPSSVTNIADYTFYQCSNPNLVLWMQGTTPPVLGGPYALDVTSPNMLIKVPASALSTYKNAPYWNIHATKIVSQ